MSEIEPTYARIEAGKVVNLEVWAEPPTISGVTFVKSAAARIGDHYSAGAFSPEEVAPTAPAEVAMHRIKKAAFLTPWSDGNLKDAIEAALASLPAPKDELGLIEWNTAPNLQRDGLTTQAVMTILGMTEQQRDDLLIFASSLP
ncbi:hypothetical protein [Caulobacter sp. FWC2]|uniref:hypothetical protein n=1 Tax=Caulobacter sp. FWC2 TaxID=69664 RepID=UPI000C14772D|nr:hypothetical protein [Caulobacter sp. FWC2]PIB91299.1 hypothetical protein CSW62_06740 [Caulobacter sp. FWC2]